MTSRTRTFAIVVLSTDGAGIVATACCAVGARVPVLARA